MFIQLSSCKLDIMRMECTGWMVVQGIALWVGSFLALCRVDKCVIIWSFLVTFWVSFWHFPYLIIRSVIFMHEGMSSEFMMLELNIEISFSGEGLVAAIGLGLWQLTVAG